MKKELKKKKNITTDVKKVKLYGSAETGKPNLHSAQWRPLRVSDR